MTSELPSPVTVADHYLAAIYDRLGEVLDRLPAREPGSLQQPAHGDVGERGGEVEITEPAPPRAPAKAVPLAEPARPPKRPPAKKPAAAARKTPAKAPAKARAGSK